MAEPTVWIISTRPELVSAARTASAGVGARLTAHGLPPAPFPTDGVVPPDLILLDATGGDATAVAFLSGVNRSGSAPVVPLLAITGDAWEERVLMFSHGAHECIVDPFHIEELTARIRGLLRLKALQKRVVARETELATANRELVRLATLKDDFIATLSHELRTPLTAICEFTSLMLDEVAGPVNDTQRECLEVAHANCQHLAMMIDDLLNLSRLASGEMRFNPVPTNLVALVNDARASLGPMAVRRQVRVTVRPSGGAVMAAVDRARMRQVIVNLLSNAIKFTAEGSDVEVAAEAVPERGIVRLEVVDQGPGLPPEQQRRVFERFFQGRPMHASKSGLGLGLNVCMEIVSQHGGRIGVESVVGKGCRFIIDLPVAAGDGAALAGPHAPDTAGRAPRRGEPAQGDSP